MTTRSQNACRFHQTPEGCRFGARCRFRHAETEPSERRREKIPSSTASKSLTTEEARFREWKQKVPRDAHRSTPGLGHQLPAFFQTARNLFQNGSAEIQQSLIRLLASGGLHRIIEAVEVIDSAHPDIDRQQQTEGLLLPLLQILSHDIAMVSPLLESDVAKVHNVLYGTNASRALPVYTALDEYLTTIDKTTEVGSEKVVLILTFTSKSVDINSNAMVSEPLCPVIDRLTRSIPDNIFIVRKQGVLLMLFEAV